MPTLTLISHHLCPYVQRAAIALSEKGVPFERITIDLADKPDWFKALSPLGKVPLLRVSEAGKPDGVIFESAVILEYLEDTQAPALHPADPLERARHRSWIEFGSAILNAIGRLYNAKDEAAFAKESVEIGALFDRVEAELADGPYFAGASFSLVDAVFGPIFRYLDLFEADADLRLIDGRARVASWRAALAARPSVQTAVTPDYPARLLTFLRNRDSVISHRLPGA
ncbi:glutathione S-transferase family protein [Azospirillum cavernae]|uniref:glutathione transferase n=1 Tax=Azospirillum cavernae TaxID=2320860 RepID=A0A418W3C9_9PROT|nr:glutathione S-transferase family protein [Azospirillum cavernae]RJF84478.1 glutathione S-transferase family protein [Azospirillum cavernae]